MAENSMSFRDTSTQTPATSLVRFREYNGSWDEYLDYLARHGAVSQDLERTPSEWKPQDGAIKSAPKRKVREVPWLGKSFEDLDEATKGELWKHLKTLYAKDKKRAFAYCEYLQKWCGYPDLSNHLKGKGDD